MSEMKLEQTITKDTPCYTLVLHSYEQHEWQRVIAVSFSREALEKEYKENIDKLWPLGSLYPLLHWKDEHDADRSKQTHWCIGQTTFVC